MEQLLAAEGRAINRIFTARGVQVATAPALTAVCGRSLVLFGLRRSAAASVGQVERLLPDLSLAVSGVRRARVSVRLSSSGVLALEVPHPSPAPLVPGASAWPNDGDLLLGRAYGFGGGRDVLIDLSEYPHLLVVGQTGSGKSNLLQSAILSAALACSPADLRLVLIDCKRDALLPLADLPHVDSFTWRADEAGGVLAWADGEIARRIAAGGVSSPRVVVVIDELRSAIAERGAAVALDRIVSVGRSLGVHVIAATQHVDFAGAIRANFTARVVGPVVSGQAAVMAAGVPGSGAQYLPGAGAFVLVAGGQVARFQGYYLGGLVPGLVARVAARWASASGAALDVRAPWDRAPVGVGAAEAAPVVEDVAGKIAGVWRAGGSHAAMIRAAFGPDANTGGANRARVLAAVRVLEGATA